MTIEISTKYFFQFMYFSSISVHLRNVPCHKYDRNIAGQGTGGFPSGGGDGGREGEISVGAGAVKGGAKVSTHLFKPKYSKFNLHLSQSNIRNTRIG